MNEYSSSAEVLKRVGNWMIDPHLMIMSFYSDNKEAKEIFDICVPYLSLIDAIRVDKLNHIGSWTVVCGRLNF